MKQAGILAMMLLASVAPASQARAQQAAHGDDSAAVAGVIAKYQESMAAGDSASSLALLTDDVVILESGRIETRAEYRSHHLAGDISFAKATRSQRGPVHVRLQGDVAWASSTSAAQGEMSGRTINSEGAELMVLVRTAQGWKISAIHWSSRQRRPG